jgi:glycosyltransferase involved in cell wall biosynthesis
VRLQKNNLFTQTMDITVILCTHNRCESLAKALDSLAALRLPLSVQWEVLVVDNNSTDLTSQVVRGFCDRYPGRFRYLSEPRQGKSYALNTGIRESQSEILAFTDDDVVVQAEWLQNLTAPLRTTQWVGVGGKTLPEIGFSPPNWLGLRRPYVYGPLGIFDLGDSPCELTEPPFGNNMAYRRDVFERHGDFRTELGPRPGSEIRSEDTELGQRILSAREHLRYEPTAVLYHAIPSNRLQKKYLLKWWSAKARANVREFGVPEGTRWFVSGIPLYLFRRLGVWTLKWFSSFNASKGFHSQLQVWSLAGEIKEHFAQSRLKK